MFTNQQPLSSNHENNDDIKVLCWGLDEEKVIHHFLVAWCAAANGDASLNGLIPDLKAGPFARPVIVGDPSVEEVARHIGALNEVSQFIFTVDIDLRLEMAPLLQARKA